MKIQTMQVSELIDLLVLSGVTVEALADWFGIKRDAFAKWQTEAPSTVLPALRALVTYSDASVSLVDLIARHSLEYVIGAGLAHCDGPQATETLG